MPSKLIRITTIPLSLEKLLEGQLSFMNYYYKVTAISADNERLEKYGQENGVATYHVEMTRAITPIKDLQAMFRLFRFFRRERPLIVHTHTPKAGILGMLAAKAAGVPIRLHTVAGMPLMETTGLKRRVLEYVEMLTYKCATRVFPNSVGLKEIILKEGFTTRKKLKILSKGSSNGIDTSYFDPSRYDESFKASFRNELGIPLMNFVFVFVGRLVTEKGINELVSAFNRLNSHYQKVTLLLVGPFEEKLDPLTPQTLQLIEAHPDIITTGYQVDVRPYFSISDALTFPSYREGFPNVVLQAGALGIPGIVTNINGCNEIIQDGHNGFIIPPKNEQKLFEVMQKLVESPRLRSEIAGNCRAEICKFYERHEFWQILLKEYKTLEQENSKV